MEERMSVEDRLAALEKRVRAAEDQLEIIRLLNTYGPLVDSAEGEPAAKLWITDGTYNVGTPGGGSRALKAPADLEALYENDGHLGLVNTGCSHLTATPRITVNGDSAEAVAYSYVVLREGERWYLWRAAVNHWTLVRTADGWRIKERFNRPLDGSKESHDTMRRVMRA
jgi:hypothetical protein